MREPNRQWENDPAERRAGLESAEIESKTNRNSNNWAATAKRIDEERITCGIDIHRAVLLRFVILLIGPAMTENIRSSSCSMGFSPYFSPISIRLFRICIRIVSMCGGHGHAAPAPAVYAMRSMLLFISFLMIFGTNNLIPCWALLLFFCRNAAAPAGFDVLLFSIHLFLSCAFSNTLCYCLYSLHERWASKTIVRIILDATRLISRQQEREQAFFRRFSSPSSSSSSSPSSPLFFHFSFFFYTHFTWLIKLSSSSILRSFSFTTKSFILKLSC